MMPIHELLNRIHWDPAFGAAHFRLGYIDRLAGGLVHGELREPLFARRRAFFRAPMGRKRGTPRGSPASHPGGLAGWGTDLAAPIPPTPKPDITHSM
jgi:hypothetical protein